MKSYLSYISVNLKLTWRDKMVIFFNYLFPLIFFFIFAQLNRAEQGGAINAVFASVLVIGVLGNGFFGGGIRAVVEREANILRRFKVAPITPAPILVSAIVVGLVNFFPAAVLMFAISHFKYGMQVPKHWISAILMIVIGTVAFRAMGQIIASVANSMAESQIIIQTLYFPMLFLSGATIPVSFLPSWVQIVTQFIPATYLFSGMQNILLRNESLAQNAQSAIALILTTVLCTFISMKLFRWEKEEKLKPTAKLWILAVLAPFFVIGAYQWYSKDNITKAKTVSRELRRSRTLLIRDARIFQGDGKILNSAAVLIKQGRIEEIYTGAAPNPEELRAEPIDASGKTLLPGLIDAQVTLTAPGGVYEKREDYLKKGAISRELAAYLFSGVTAVGSAGDPMDRILPDLRRVETGEKLGADVFLSGPLFTAKGGMGTEFVKFIPPNVRDVVEAEMVRVPANADDARRMVIALKAAGVRVVKAALDGGVSGQLLNRLDPQILRVIGAECKAQHLPLLVATGDAKDVIDAIDAGANVIVNGSSRERIPDAVFESMKSKGISYLPMLAAREGMSGNLNLLERSLVQQVGPPDLLAATMKRFATIRVTSDEFLEKSIDNLRRAYGLGVDVIAGSGAGGLMVFHGPAIHREMQLWVKAGLPSHAALEGATVNAAKLFGVSDRLGVVQKGREATLLLVNGNPLQDILATEAISLVIFKGERVSRPELFEKDPD